MDTDMFFHQVGASVHVRQALKVCNGDADRPPCPVKDECLEFALSFAKEDDIAGVFGGLTPAERQKIRKQRRDDQRDGLSIIERAAPAGEGSFVHQLGQLLSLIHDAVSDDAVARQKPL
jgi:hypothetical protein